jgi:hypothetical protein
MAGAFPCTAPVVGSPRVRAASARVQAPRARTDVAGRWSGAHPAVVLRRRTLRFILVPCHDRSSLRQVSAPVVVGPGAWRHRAPGHSRGGAQLLVWGIAAAA